MTEKQTGEVKINGEMKTPEMKAFAAIREMGRKVYQNTGLDVIFQIDEKFRPDRKGLGERLHQFLEERGYAVIDDLNLGSESAYSEIDIHNKIWRIPQGTRLEELPFFLLVHECVHIADNSHHIYVEGKEFTSYRRPRNVTPLRREARAYAVNVYLGQIKSLEQWKLGTFGSIGWCDTGFWEEYWRLKNKLGGFVIKVSD